MQGQDQAGWGQLEPGKPLSAEAVAWAFRLLIGRDPFSPEEVEAHRGLPDLATLRRAFANTWEFFDFFDSAVDGVPTYGMPLFLMRPPADPAFPFRFTPPSLDEPVCQFCTMSQFDDAAFAEIVQAMGMSPTRTRRSWEQVWIVSMLATAGLIGPGRTAIGFGVGRERIPSLLASRGVRVLASDTPNQDGDAQLPPGAQHMALFHPEILHLEDFEAMVGYRPIDMNHLPDELEGQFDFCWSASAVDRLGSLAKATEFLENSLRVLKPGGLSVHTFGLNIRSDVATVDHPLLALLRRRDIEQLASTLQVQGHEILPVNFHPGLEPLDAEVMVKPDGPPRPKQRHGALILTSFGLAIRKAA
ncbi:methyltransferase domain-containing protein [Falsiroseomonas selenitidurans]|uniref:Methyltransferase domain-containing protein n=1 Tax=Falsiroseomonas selenitidurans TaxID=2716335 RepID=A0ABX1E434_9PROT|nr:methyltransferase domain-containing protein [Falsiroseomonas selenitidurans]NKC31761.1 methyltransferase domain-containing protein [Falsiroseomonas selenitidurans]